MTGLFKRVLFYALFCCFSISAAADTPSPRIVGGSAVPEGRADFMAALYIDRNGTDRFLFSCGGSYIGDRWILTAAHCVVNVSNGFTLPLPAQSLRTKTGVKRLADDGTVLGVTEVVVHPEYDTRTGEADIALLRLASTPGENVTRIGVPPQRDSFPVTDGVATVAGWGATSEGGRGSSVLLEADLQLVSQAECLPFYPSSLDAGAMFCAGGDRTGGEDSCQGDSGGPIWVVRDSFIVQAGIVSSGIGCARPSIPGVYTRVSHYSDWIRGVATSVRLSSGTIEPDNTDQTFYIPVGSLQAGGVAVQGAINLGDVRVYELLGNVRRVQLSSISGNADLYIVSGTSFDSTDISCESIDPGFLDSCPVTDSSRRQFALVFGYENSLFNVEAQTPQEDPLPGPLPGPLQASSSSGAIGYLIILGLMFKLIVLTYPRRRIR